MVKELADPESNYADKLTAQLQRANAEPEPAFPIQLALRPFWVVLTPCMPQETFSLATMGQLDQDRGKLNCKQLLMTENLTELASSKAQKDQNWAKMHSKIPSFCLAIVQSLELTPGLCLASLILPNPARWSLTW